MGLFDFIGPASGLLFTLENIIWINLGVFIGCVFAAIPGLSVILCIILFLPVTYTMKAIPGMMFLLGIYCAGGYGGSVSAILINTPGTPHAAATMLDGHPLSKMGRTKAALKIALYASTFGGIFSALVLLFLGPQVAKISAQLGTAEYFMVCLFGMTIIAGVSGKSLVKGIIAACLGLLISCVGADPMTSYDRFTFGVHRLYLGLDLAVTLIGLFALVEIIGKAELKRSELNLHAGKIGNDDGKITKDEYKRMLRPVLIGSLIGSCVGIVPGTGASEASWFSYNTAKNMSKHPEEFGHGSVEGVAAAESANNAVCGATLIPLLTLGIPFIKIGSGEIGNIPYLRYMGSKKKPVLLSTGMSSLADVELSLEALRQGGAEDITLLHCTTSYPCPYDRVNLRAMDTLRAAFGLPVGYSDHTEGIAIPTAAVALGAVVIEKHFTLDRHMEGPDHLASTEPEAFRQMVSAIRQVEAGLGCGRKTPSPEERSISEVVLKRVVAARPIPAGTILTADDLTVKRNDRGLSARYWALVIGTPARRDYAADDAIEL